MATNQKVCSVSLPASGAFTDADLYKAVKVDSNGRVALAAAGERAIGILYSTATALGQAVEVAISGIMKVKVAASVTLGAALASDANGLLVAADLAVVNTSDAGAAGDAVIGSNVLGVALEAGGTNAIIEFLWQPIGASPTTVS